MAEALLVAVGVAASPFAVIPAVLLLFAPRSTACSAAFAAGWACGVGAVTALAVLLADVITLPEAPPTWASWTRVGLGAALVVTGLLKLRGGPDETGPPSWLRSLEGATPATAGRFGLLASARNPKVALLATAGGFAIGSGLQGPAREVLATLAFTLVASSTAVAPALLHAVLGERALRPLGRVKDWLTAHTDLALAVVLVAIGAALLWKGVGAL
jgi:hypothetical protein